MTSFAVPGLIGMIASNLPFEDKAGDLIGTVIGWDDGYVVILQPNGHIEKRGVDVCHYSGNAWAQPMQDRRLTP